MVILQLSKAGILQIDGRIEEIRDRGVRRMREIGDLADGADAAVHDNGDAVGDRPGEVAVVRDDDRGDGGVFTQRGDDLGDRGDMTGSSSEVGSS